MARFVLRYCGQGEARAADLERIRGVAGLRVVDSASRMLLVEAEKKRLSALMEMLPAWALIPEQIIPKPDPRLKLRKQR